LRQRFLREYPEFEDKSMVLYPCPDEELLSPPSDVVIEEMRNQLALRGKKIILSVGRLTDGKGFTHFIRMLPEIARKYPHVIWLLIGEGEKREYVLEQIRARNLQSVVRFIGPVPHSEIGRYYHLADLFVLLTHPDEGMEEGLGLVFLEAAASGLAVVAGKSGGVEEAVIHAETGIMVDVYRDGDDAIEDTIVDLLEQDAYRQELGQTAQQRIRSEFRWPSQIARLERWMK
jgi:phosphatidylinositol alpha-1,6-mannosyltransferase